MTREERKQHMMELYGVKHIEELNDGFKIARFYDFVFEKYGDVKTIYKECDESERKTFLEYVIKCYNEDKEMLTHIVENEGVRDESTESYFEWYSRHSVWYEIT